MPARSKPHLPISALGPFDGAGAGSEDGAGAGADDATSGAGAGVGAGGAVAAGLFDPQPAIVARAIASSRVFTGASGDWKVRLAYQATAILPRASAVGCIARQRGERRDL